MRKILCLIFLNVSCWAFAASAHKTAYCRPTMNEDPNGKKTLTCPEATATCYTIYDNGEVDIFFDTGTQRWKVVTITNAPTGELVSYEELPEIIQPEAYFLEVEDEP